MGYFGIPFRNGVPIGLGSIVGFGAPQEFSPSELFLGGTAGAWYDPSDLSTMFTTSAGTTQCAMPGLGSAVSVGLMLDKSQGVQRFWSGYFDGAGDYLTAPSNAAFQYGTGNFTVEGWHYLTAAASSTKYLFDQRISGTGVIPALYISGGSYLYYINTSPALTAGTVVANTWVHWAIVRNSGTTTLYINGSAVGSFADSNNYSPAAQFRIGSEWSASGLYDWQGYLSNVRAVKGVAVYTANFTPPSPVTGLTAISGTSLLTCQNSTFIDNSSNAFAVTVNGNTTASQNIPLGNHAIAFNDTTARPELRARVNLLVATATLSTQNVTTQATSYTLRFAGTGSITLSGTATGSYSAGTHTITCTAGTLTLTVSGTVTTADLRPANSGALLPAYQAVVDANTYDTSGFPLYLLFEGAVGQRGMYTPANLNLSGTDKVAVFAGVRKNATSPSSVMVESSSAFSSNNGSFIVSTDATVGHYFGLRGTGEAAYGSTFTAPQTSVQSVVYDIAGAAIATEIFPRINGAIPTLAVSSAGPAGSGNFGTYPLYIGSRNNSSLWLNGQIYSLIIAGSAVSASNISATEQWVAGKVGIVIP